jgi:hypothetical protein
VAFVQALRQEQVIGLPQDAVEKAGRLDGLARSKVAKEHGACGTQ